jgi:hypothetical protein
MNRSILCLFFLLAVSLPIPAGAAGGDSQGIAILGVDMRCGPSGEGATAGLNGPQGRYLKKFVEDLPPPEAVCEVTWRAPAGGLPAGAAVRLDFVRKGFDKAESFVIKYPAPVRGDQKATFQVPRRSTGEAVGLAAWRVQVLRSEQVLAEAKSEAWR